LTLDKGIAVFHLSNLIPCSDEWGKLFGVSERTLQRRRRDPGRSFSAVVEEFRHEEAVRLLQEGRLHLVQIAVGLGCAEQTSFKRAFKRWTGETPSARRAARQG